MNEFEIRDELREKRKSIKTFHDLTTFLKDVEQNYNCGYGEAPRAMAQAACATAGYLAGKFGITGFQASCVMWDFIRDWMYRNNECGMKLVDYDLFLCPQYAYRFEKTISKETWESIQKVAQKCLDEKEGCVHPAVLAHWQSIVDGTVPFGYSVEEEGNG